MLCTVGCHTTSPTRRWCATKSTTGSSRFLSSPPSGICQILMVQSSEPLAMMSSSCGHHWMSSTAARWPTTSGQSRSTRPICQSQTSAYAAAGSTATFHVNRGQVVHTRLSLLFIFGDKLHRLFFMSWMRFPSPNQHYHVHMRTFNFVLHKHAHYGRPI